MDAIPVPLHKFSDVRVDLVGPWPHTAEGHTHLLTAVDRTKRWAEAIPLQSKTAQVVANSFVANWVSRFGVPITITTDQGTRCRVAVYVQRPGCQAHADYCLPTSVQQHSRVLPPAAKGSTTCQVQRSRLAGALPWVLLGLCAAPKEEAGVSAAEATYGHSLMLPSQLQPPSHTPQAAPAIVDIPSTVKPAREAEKAQEVGVQEASHIYVHEGAVTGPLDATYCLLVKEQKKMLLEIGDERTWVSVDRLKPKRGQDSGGGAATPMWPSAQVLEDFIFYIEYGSFVLS